MIKLSKSTKNESRKTKENIKQKKSLYRITANKICVNMNRQTMIKFFKKLTFMKGTIVHIKEVFFLQDFTNIELYGITKYHVLSQNHNFPKVLYKSNQNSKNDTF